MSQTKFRYRFQELLISQSKALKVTIFFSGVFLIILGTEIRRTDPVFGYTVLLVGLLADGGIVYIVYIEISRIRQAIEEDRKQIEEIYREINDVVRDIRDTHREINRIKDGVFDDRNADLKRRASMSVENQIKDLEHGKIRQLEEKVNKIDSTLESLRREVDRV